MIIKATVHKGKIKLLEDVELPENANLLITVYSDDSSHRGKPKRKLGGLKHRATYKIEDDFKISDEEVYRLFRQGQK